MANAFSVGSRRTTNRMTGPLDPTSTEPSLAAIRPRYCSRSGSSYLVTRVRSFSSSCSAWAHSVRSSASRVNGVPPAAMGGTLRLAQDTAASATTSRPAIERDSRATSVQRSQPLANLAELLAHGLDVLRLRTPGEIALPVVHALVEMAQADENGPAITEVRGRARVEDQQPVVHGERLDPLVPLRVDRLEVHQHAREDLALAHRRQVLLGHRRPAPERARHHLGRPLRRQHGPAVEGIQ